MWVEVKYANLISAYLDKFKVLSLNPYKANFRCPLCGDSKKDLNKARGYFFQDVKTDKIKFKCHNCGANRNLASILKELNKPMFEDYVAEVFVNRRRNTQVEERVYEPDRIFQKYADNPLKKLKKISQLAWDHPAKQYVEKRKIPTEAHARLYYCSKFATWTNSMIPDKLPEKMDTPRLVIPFMDEKGNMFGYQGRSFDPNEESKLRYISIMLDDRQIKVFGLNKCNMNKKHYIFEGPIDSLFIPNSIAMAGSDINKNIANENSVFVYDNEPRNKEITGMIHKRIENGFRVFIWPHKLDQYKDLNDCILAGYSAKEMQTIIDDNTWSGLAATMEFNSWKKI